MPKIIKFYLRFIIIKIQRSDASKYPSSLLPILICFYKNVTHRISREPHFIERFRMPPATGLHRHNIHPRPEPIWKFLNERVI